MAQDLQSLNKDDLYLLMESYRNMIQMHSTLVEQQKQIIDLQNHILAKQDAIASKQTQSCDQLKGVAEKLEACAANLLKTNDTITSTSMSLDKTMSNGLDLVKDKIGGGQLELTKQHSGINVRLYVAMGGMATIIIGLIGLLMALSGKFDLITEIHKAIHVLLTHFSLSVGH